MKYDDSLPDATAEHLAQLPFDELWQMLPTQYQRFIDRYAELRFQNATQAYIDTIWQGSREGVNRAQIKAYAYKVMKHPLIDAVLRQVGEVAKLNVLSAVAHLTELATADIGEFLDVVVITDKTGAPILDAMGRYQYRVELNLAKAIEERRTYPIKSLKNTEHGLQIELDNRQSALRTILELSGQIGPARGTAADPVHQVAMSLDDWKAETAKRLKAASDTLDTFADADVEQGGLDSGALDDAE